MSGQTLTRAFIGLPGNATAVFTASGLDHYRHADWLGSARLSSSPTQTVLSTTAYAPFGEPYATSGTADPSFTGQDQDTASGIYDFPAREYSMQGRWPSPDPGGLATVDPTNPQTWNRYAYVSGNPLALTDPTGLQDCNSTAAFLAELGLHPSYNLDGGGYNPCALENDNTPDEELAYLSTPVYSAADPPPSGYFNSGATNPDDGRPIFVNSNGDIWIGLTASMSSSLFISPIIANLPAAVFNSGPGRAPNNTKQAIVAGFKWARQKYCGSSAGYRVMQSIVDGALVGGAVGALGGGISGEIFGGEVTLGATGVVGAVAGGVIGGSVGAANGLTTGVLAAAGCSLVGAY